MSSFWQMIIMMVVKAFLDWSAKAEKEDAEKLAKNINAGVKAYNS